MHKLRVVLEYFHPWPNSAGFYLARERGWYADAGLEVVISVPDPGRGDSLAHLINREADFAIAPSNRLLVRRVSQQPIQGVAAINHGGLEAIQTLTDSRITRPRELAGRRLAMNPTPRGLAMVRHLVSQDGGDPDEIIIVDAGLRELRPQDLAKGMADASFGGYWAWEALMESPIEEHRRVVWPVDQIGAPAYHSYQLCAHEDFLNNAPDVVRNFLAVTARGYLAAATSPLEALDVYEKTTPYFPRALLAASLSRVAASWLHEGRWGEQRRELLEGYAHWLADYGVLPNPQVWREAADNRYLP